jgi:sugar phosphate permease
VEDEIEAGTIAQLAWRFIPFLMLCYFVAYLDRVNIGFAKLTMDPDLKLSDTAFGFGAGVFFLSYFLFEVPSNIILDRVGARTWIGAKVRWFAKVTKDFRRKHGFGGRIFFQ